MFKKYYTRDLLNFLGVSRDALRFYEEKGLLNPQKNSENNYRNYDVFDIYNLMIINFYKKRGMTINQIQELLQKSDAQYVQSVLESKKKELVKMIYDAQCMLEKLEDTQEFCRNLEGKLNIFTVKGLPLYKINGEISDFIAIEEYGNLKDIMHSNNNDMLSQIMRYIAFDKDCVTDTKMFIVDVAEIKDESEIYLQYPKCLYTVVEEIQSINEQEDLMKNMHRLSAEYAEIHDLTLLGEAFAMIRLITHKESETKAYIEIFIPFE